MLLSTSSMAVSSEDETVMFTNANKGFTLPHLSNAAYLKIRKRTNNIPGSVLDLNSLSYGGH